DAAKVKSAAESISKTGDKIAKIVKSLRAFAHSQDNVPMDTISVHELVQETLDFCKVRFYNHGIDIQVGQIPDDLEIQCRLIQIEEVLLNLFNNAHDAILELPERWIIVEAFDRGANVHIQITDSGNGIPEKVADSMMMPFFTTKTMGRGLGLGLSIVTDIVEKHHGQIFLDRTHSNTRFVVSLPKVQK
ncbi:MAG: GHKL domain-containing protein, partial [Proteobacteria bacterium]